MAIRIVSLHSDLDNDVYGFQLYERETGRMVATTSCSYDSQQEDFDRAVKMACSEEMFQALKLAAACFYEGHAKGSEPFRKAKSAVLAALTKVSEGSK